MRRLPIDLVAGFLGTVFFLASVLFIMPMAGAGLIGVASGLKVAMITLVLLLGFGFVLGAGARGWPRCACNIRNRTRKPDLAW